MPLRFHRFAHRRKLLLLGLSIGVCACSNTNVIANGGPDAADARVVDRAIPEAGPVDARETRDARPDATRDAGPEVTDAPGDTGDSPFGSVPQIVLNAGTVMTTPNVRPIYFSGETLATQVDDLLAQYLTSSAWKAATTEYGIGAGTLLTPVMSTFAPAAMVTDADVQGWLTSQLDGTHPEFGAVDATTLASEIFMLSYPAGTTITGPLGGMSCFPVGTGFGGYHANFAVGTNAVQYVVLPRCNSRAAALLIVSSYEVLATASNPFPRTLPAYYGFDKSHAIWDLVGGDPELPGPCSGETVLLDGGYPVPRGWSNAAMAAYHDPCVPTPDSTPYFASVPIMNDDVIGATGATKGIKVASGHSKTIDVQLWSDGPTKPWSVAAEVFPGGSAPAGALSFAFDHTTGNNGDVLHLTVTPHQAGPIPFVVVSTLSIKQTKWYGLVGQ